MHKLFLNTVISCPKEEASNKWSVRIDYPSSRVVLQTGMVQEEKYVCPLSEETKALAAEELREDEASRENGIKHLKKWAEDNPKIESCRTGRLRWLSS